MWPFRLKGSLRSVSGAPDAPAPGAAGGWASLPAIQRVIDPIRTTLGHESFQRDLAVQQPPHPFLGPLGHGVSSAAPSGVVDGLLMPSAQRAQAAPALAHLSPTKARHSVQRRPGPTVGPAIAPAVVPSTAPAVAPGIAPASGDPEGVAPGAAPPPDPAPPVVQLGEPAAPRLSTAVGVELPHLQLQATPESGAPAELAAAPWDPEPEGTEAPSPPAPLLGTPEVLGTSEPEAVQRTGGEGLPAAPSPTSHPESGAANAPVQRTTVGALHLPTPIPESPGDAPAPAAPPAGVVAATASPDQAPVQRLAPAPAPTRAVPSAPVPVPVQRTPRPLRKPGLGAPLTAVPQTGPQPAHRPPPDRTPPEVPVQHAVETPVAPLSLQTPPGQAPAPEAEIPEPQEEPAEAPDEAPPAAPVAPLLAQRSTMRHLDEREAPEPLPVPEPEPDRPAVPELAAPVQPATDRGPSGEAPRTAVAPLLAQRSVADPSDDDGPVDVAEPQRRLPTLASPPLSPLPSTAGDPRSDRLSPTLQPPPPGRVTKPATAPLLAQRQLADGGAPPVPGRPADRAPVAPVATNPLQRPSEPGLVALPLPAPVVEGITEARGAGDGITEARGAGEGPGQSPGTDDDTPSLTSLPMAATPLDVRDPGTAAARPLLSATQRIPVSRLAREGSVAEQPNGARWVAHGDPPGGKGAAAGGTPEPAGSAPPFPARTTLPAPRLPDAGPPTVSRLVQATGGGLPAVSRPAHPAEAALSAGIAQRAWDGSIVFHLPAGEAPEPPPPPAPAPSYEVPVQRVGEETPSTPTVTASAAPAPGGAGAAGGDLDDLARKLYPRIRPYLKKELWLDRERAGMLTGSGR